MRGAMGIAALALVGCAAQNVSATLPNWARFRPQDMPARVVRLAFSDGSAVETAGSGHRFGVWQMSMPGPATVQHWFPGSAWALRPGCYFVQVGPLACENVSLGTASAACQVVLAACSDGWFSCQVCGAVQPDGSCLGLRTSSSRGRPRTRNARPRS